MYRLICVAVVLVTSSARADVIDFSSLAGLSNQTPYSGSVEGDFTVSVLEGEWQVAGNFGGPVPSIFGRSNVGVVEVVQNVGQQFTLGSIDFADAGTGSPPADFLVQGYLGGSMMFAFDGTSTSTFQTYANTDSGIAVDRVEITMFRRSATYNMDNIVVNIVPSPSTLALIGVSGTVLIRRRR